jgi:predicted RNase H-like nuclease (RuvC/YqgF family)
LQLFDFDVEVEPVLEVLVGKTVEQALIEVLEEEELEALRVQQRRFRELRASEKAEQQRLEKQDRRLREEKVTQATLPPAFRFPSLQSRFRM